MPIKTGRDPAQFGLFATPLEAMIAPDAEVRVIAAFVDQLELPKLGFKQINPMGASAYPAEVLLKIYLYGYLNRVRSSRRLERECRVNVEMMWLTGNLQPKHKTIAEFRRIHPKALKKVFREYVLLLKKWELIGGERLAVDGTKVNGQNARKKNFNTAKIQRHLDRIDDRIGEAMEEFARQDAYEDSEEKSELRARTQDALDVLKARKAEYTSHQDRLAESDDTQVSLTDPDARSLIKHGRESLVGYNLQSVVDDANKLIVHTQVTNESDLNALGRLVEDTHETLGLEQGTEILADKGYYNATEMQFVRDMGHKTFVAERRHASHDKVDTYPLTAFCYDGNHDAHTFPAVNLLNPPGTPYPRPASRRENALPRRQLEDEWPACRRRNIGQDRGCWRARRDRQSGPADVPPDHADQPGLQHAGRSAAPRAGQCRRPGLPSRGLRRPYRRRRSADADGSGLPLCHRRPLRTAD